MTCREVRQRLADDPQAATADEATRDHLAGCKACQDMLARLEAVDEALQGMGAMDPPVEVVERTLERVQTDKPARHKSYKLVLALGPVMVVLLLGVTFLFTGLQEQARGLFASSANALAGNEDLSEEAGRFVQVVAQPDGGPSPAARYTLGPPPPPAGGEDGDMSGEASDRGGQANKPADADGWGDDRFGHKGLLDFGSNRGEEGFETPEGPLLPALDQQNAWYERTELTAKQPVPVAPSEQPQMDEPEEPALDLPDSSVVDRNVADLSDGERLARSARFVPHLEDGKATGFKVFNVRPGSELDDLGVRNGDVIQTIDGRDVTTPDKALSAYRSLRDKDSFELGVDRKGEKLRLIAGSDRGDTYQHADDGSEPIDEIAALEKNLAKDEEERRRLVGARANRQIQSPSRGNLDGPQAGEDLVPADPAPAQVIANGSLVIESTPPGAKVLVDGRTVGATPFSGVQVRPGAHRVELQREGYRTRTVAVTVAEGERKRIRLHLPTAGATGMDPELVARARAVLDAEQAPPERLRFIPAQGYFRNTYLPGDPHAAWLRERLQTGLFLDGERLALERAAAAYRQPFDPPANAGLAVYLAADRAAVEGPTRMTLQVGLKGSTRHAVRRAALNAVLVVDLRSLPDEQARQTLWSLADAMAGDVQAGDRFWLVTVGADVAVKVTPGRFEPTAVRRALAQALLGLEGREPESGGLGEGLKEAYDLLAGPAGEEAAPLGANLVLVASAGPLGEPADDLAALAHRWALAGVTTSSLGVAGQTDASGLGELALAGQGRRRLVAAGAEAERVVGAELAACGSVVARAVRLRIRLAEGVRLVGVLGSEPLDAARAERVRQAEQAVDRRVASSLGIEADRGEDEEGIQIVIPAFYSGDDHVILLDVLAVGPGPLADVQVRYKDLVNLSNAVARARLSLPRGQRPAGPLNLNVSKNVLAHRLGQDLDRAAAALARDRFARGRQALAVASLRIQRFVETFPQLADDPELIRDETLVAGYLKVMGDLPAWQAAPAVREHLVHSLQLAALAKRAAWGIE